MKKTDKKSSKKPDKDAIFEEDEMLEEYDFSGGVRGKYASRMAEGTNIVLLDPDVWAAFPDSESVNRALRLLIEIAQREPGEKVLAEKKATYAAE